MAPALLETLPTAPYQSKKAVDTTIFHDGIKTSGQHPPLYDQLRPYSEFPKVCSGPSLWKPEDYKDNPEKWVHRFTDEEIEELGSVADKFIADGIPLTGISKVRRHQSSKEAVLTNCRATSFSQSSGNSWQTSSTTLLKARDSYSSKASQSKYGITTSARLHTWDSAHT